MKKVIILLLSLFGLSLLSAKQALAVCPLCTLTVSAGIGLSRWLGIDDSITGLWIGGLTVSAIAWTLSWFDKKHISFKGRGIATSLAYYLLIITPLYFTGSRNNPLRALYPYGPDRLLLGIIVGSIGFWCGATWYYYIRKKNNGHAYFPFQKVVMPVSPLIVLSIVFYFLTN